LDHIGPVERGGDNVDHHFVGPGHRVVDVLDREYFWTAM
jgi:hypothetical protein